MDIRLRERRRLHTRVSLVSDSVSGSPVRDALVRLERVVADQQSSYDAETDDRDHAEREAEDLEDGSLDPDELIDEPAWWDEGSDDET
jgi:cell division protein FtsB